MNQALLLIDIQNDYFANGAMELAGSDEAAAYAAKLLIAFRAKGLPVIHIQHLAIKPGATFFVPGSKGAETHASVAPHEGETVFQKNFPNSFRDTPLQAHLQKLQVKQLFIAGMMTQMCVDTTVRCANDLGYECLLAHDACATRDMTFEGTTVPAAQVQAAFMAALNGSFAKVQTAESMCSLV